MPDEKPATIEYGRSDPRQTFSLVRVGIALAIIVPGIFLYCVSQTEFPWQRDRAYQVKCASNMRQIGQAILLYQQDYAGAHPPDLTAVLATQQLSSDVFWCPSSPDTRSPTTQRLAQPGHCSYIYVGSSFARSGPDAVLLFEDPANQELEGGNMVFADGHAEWLALPQFMSILQDLSAGINPPSTQPTTLTQSAAEKLYKAQWQSRMPQLKSGVWRIPSTQPTTRS
jgi:prepilin-type processing-associated H-X9-DG protein